MSAQGLIVVVAMGAAAIAMWLDVRLERRTPRSMMWTLVHTGGSMIALKMMPQLVTLVVAGSDSPVRKIAAMLTVILPGLIYCWLAAIWLLKLVQRAAHLR